MFRSSSITNVHLKSMTILLKTFYRIFLLILLQRYEQTKPRIQTLSMNKTAPVSFLSGTWPRPFSVSSSWVTWWRPCGPCSGPPWCWYSVPHCCPWTGCRRSSSRSCTPSPCPSDSQGSAVCDVMVTPRRCPSEWLAHCWCHGEKDSEVHMQRGREVL